MNNVHYFNFPLSLMQFIKHDNDKNGLLKIIAFAVMTFSEKLNYKKTNVANQIIYLFYRRTYFLNSSVKDYLNEMINDGRLIEDEDYRGFSGDSFTPETECEGMISEFESNVFFYTQCVHIYKEHQAISLLKLNPELIDVIRNHYQEVTKFVALFEKKNGPDAWTSVSNTAIFEAYAGTLSMDYLRLIASVKSVLNKKNFNLSYKSVLLCRMFGCKKSNILDDLFINNPDLQDKHTFLLRRRQWDKLIDSAMNRGLITHYCTGRQFFVSVTMTKDELKKAVETKRETKEIKISA